MIKLAMLILLDKLAVDFFFIMFNVSIPIPDWSISTSQKGSVFGVKLPAGKR